MSGITMFSKGSLLVACALLSACDSGIVDTLPKCSMKDEICYKNLIETALESVSKTGIPELNIPPIDPVHLKNVTVSILGLINITLIDGVAKGVKDCVIDSVDSQIEKGFTKFEITCDLIIDGKFRVKGTSPVLKNLFGVDSIHGDGNAKVKLDKVHIAFEFFFHFYKGENGDVYGKSHPDEYRYHYSIGHMHLSAENIFLGENDATDLIVGFLNENWKSFMQKFGNSFFDVAMGLFYDEIRRFFEKTPTKNYILEDLSYLVKNEPNE